VKSSDDEDCRFTLKLEEGNRGWEGADDRSEGALATCRKMSSQCPTNRVLVAVLGRNSYRFDPSTATFPPNATSQSHDDQSSTGSTYPVHPRTTSFYPQLRRGSTRHYGSCLCAHRLRRKLLKGSFPGERESRGLSYAYVMCVRTHSPREGATFS
jgi:hypothetical protein